MAIPGKGWQTALLQGIRAPVTQENIRFLTAWQQAEGGTAANNPMNTTQPYQGASNYNGVGVKNYRTAQDGINATVHTLLNGHYNNIVKALRSGKASAAQMASLHDELSTWGTGDGILRVLGEKRVAVPKVGAPQTGQPLGGGAGSQPLAASAVEHFSSDALRAQHAADAARLQHAQGLIQAAVAFGQGDSYGNFTSNLMDLAQQRAQAQGAMQLQTTDPHGSLNHPATKTSPGSQTSGNLVGLAAQQIGQPYVWGGESRKEGGFDCSGLVDWAMRQQGYNGPRLTTGSIAHLGKSVKGQKLRPGDLILANNGDHVVIYAGGGKVIAAPHTGTVVQYQPVSRFNITDVRRV